MRAGIGLPSMLPATKGANVIHWAEAAEAAGFDSLSSIDRVCYGNQDALIAFAGAAAVTQHIRLMTTVLLAGVREPVMLAKQLASLDVLSNGRVTLGLGAGMRKDDFAATGQRYNNRGKRLEQTIETMRRVWRGEPAGDNAGPVGPKPVQPGGPPIYIGAMSDAAIARVGKYADGYIGAGSPDMAAAIIEKVSKSWQAAGRSGKPKFVATAYFALGEAAAEQGRAYLQDYYSFMGPAADFMAQSLLTTVDAVAQTYQRLVKMGFDEVSFWPTVADVTQVRLLAEAVEAAR